MDGYVPTFCNIHSTGSRNFKNYSQASLLQLQLPCCNFLNCDFLNSSTQSISASIKDTTVNGVEGLNINWVAPFKFDDYVVGFRYALGNLKKAPESLFAKRTYDTPIIEGAATVDVDYNLDSKVFAVESKWVGKGKNFTL